MTCIHTGARVRLAEYDAVVICDIHVICGVVVLRTACRMEHRAPPNPDGYQLRIGRGVWFDQEQDYGTLIAPLRSLIVPPQHIERFARERLADKVGVVLTVAERSVLDWLGREEASQLGACKGGALDSLVAKGLVQVLPRPQGYDEDYRAVILTPTGVAVVAGNDHG